MRKIVKATTVIAKVVIGVLLWLVILPVRGIFWLINDLREMGQPPHRGMYGMMAEKLKERQGNQARTSPEKR